MKNPGKLRGGELDGLIRGKTHLVEFLDEPLLVVMGKSLQLTGELRHGLAGLATVVFGHTANKALLHDVTHGKLLWLCHKKEKIPPTISDR